VVFPGSWHGLILTRLPGSVRSILIFRGSEFIFGPCGEILYSIEAGLAARAKIYGMEAFDYLKTHPETAGIFDDAMTSMCSYDHAIREFIELQSLDSPSTGRWSHETGLPLNSIHMLRLRRR
jgi:hypothetical protein